MKRSSGLKPVICVAIFFVFTVLFYGPLSLYLPNSEELWFKLREVFKVIVPVSAIAFVMIYLFFFVMPKKVRPLLLTLFFGGALAFYVQGNLINNTYGTGVMDGSGVDWASYKAYGIRNTAIWLGCILLPLIVSFFMRKKKELFHKGLAIAALFLTAIQIPALAVQLFSYRPNINGELRMMNEGIFDLSAKENIVFIMLDTVDEDYYQTFIEEEPEYIDQLTGFVHYDNTTASGARTMLAFPSMFTGRPYTRQETYSDYLTEVWSSPNCFSALHDDGYDVRIYSETVLFSDAVTEYVSNITVKGGQVGSYKVLTKKIYKLDLFKFLPHILKKRFYMDTAEFEKAKDTSGEYLMKDARFIQSYRDAGFSLTNENEKVFTLYHLRGAHPGYNIDRDGYTKKGSNVNDQVAGCMRVVAEMLQDMKELGIYDDATIIITADHGDHHVGEWAFLLIKEPGSTDPYQTSSKPVSLFDMAIYLADLAGTTLENQTYGTDFRTLDEDAIRERHVFVNSSGSSKPVVDEYVTTGYAGDRDDLVLLESHETVIDEALPYELGTKLSFETEATGNPYLTDGATTNTGFRTKIKGPLTTLQIPLASDPDHDLTAIFTLFYGGGIEKPVMITANGQVVYEGVITKKSAKSPLSFKIPKSVFEGTAELCLQLHFTYLSEDEMELPVEDRTYTISLKSLTIE